MIGTEQNHSIPRMALSELDSKSEFKCVPKISKSLTSEFNCIARKIKMQQQESDKNANEFHAKMTDMHNISDDKAAISYARHNAPRMTSYDAESDAEEDQLVVDEDADVSANDVTSTTSHEEPKDLKQESRSHIREANEVITSTSPSPTRDMITTSSTAISNPIRSLENVVNRLAPVSLTQTQHQELTENADHEETSTEKKQYEDIREPENLSKKEERQSSMYDEKSKSVPDMMPFPYPGMMQMGAGGFPYSMTPTGMFPPVLGMERMMQPGMPFPPFADMGLMHRMGLPMTFPGMSFNTTTPKRAPSPRQAYTPEASNDFSPATAPLDLSGSANKRKSPESHEYRPENDDTLSKKRKVEEERQTPVKPTPTTHQPSWYRDALSKFAAASAVNHDVTRVKDDESPQSSAFSPLRSAPFATTPTMSPFSMYPPFMNPALMGFGAMFNPYLMAGVGFPGSSPLTGSPAMSMTSPPMTSPPEMNSSRPRDAITQEHDRLMADFDDIIGKLGKESTVYKAQQSYLAARRNIQVERHRAKSSAMAADLTHAVVMEKYYDNQLLSLIHLAKTQLEAEKKSLEFGSKLKAEPLSDRLLTVPFGAYNGSSNRSYTPPEMTKPLHASSPHQMLSPITSKAKFSPGSSAFHHHSSPRSTLHQQHHSVPFQISPTDPSCNTSGESGFLDASDMSPTDPSHPSNRKRFLSNATVDVLQAWYDKHREHPYPDDEECEVIARDANISEVQVRKWMANKRMRNSNTLAHNGSIHPKKLQKLIQMRENNSDLHQQPTLPTPIPELLTQPTTASNQSQSPTQQQTNFNMAAAQQPGSDVLEQMRMRGVEIKPRKQKAKRLLNPKAVEAMNNWYFEHINYPYPTDDEKQQLADDNGITVPQVTCWFANKRNRSNNTRKMGSTPSNGAMNARKFWGKFSNEHEVMTSYSPLSMTSQQQASMPAFPVLGASF